MRFLLGIFQYCFLIERASALVDAFSVVRSMFFCYRIHYCVPGTFHEFTAKKKKEEQEEKRLQIKRTRDNFRALLGQSFELTPCLLPHNLYHNEIRFLFKLT